MDLTGMFNKRNRSPLLCRDRPDWMTNEQWRQMREYALGNAVPTDPELLIGIKDFDLHNRHGDGSRFQAWAWFNISACLLGIDGFNAWAKLIGYDVDYQMDEGL